MNHSPKVGVLVLLLQPKMQRLETTIISYLAHEPPVWAVFGQRRLMAAPASTGAAPLRVRGFAARLAHSAGKSVLAVGWEYRQC